MARINVFQGGSIQPQSPSVTPYRAPDFGPGIGPGIEKLGQGIGEAAQKVDEIQDFNARIEANKHSIAFNKLSTAISQRVRSTLGEGAEAAADKGIEDLRTGAAQILKDASPRAQRILQAEFDQRTDDLRQQWWNYGFEQKKQAYDTSSQAANDEDLEAALDQSTEKDAQPYLDSIRRRNSERSTFFGLGSAWETQENAKATSGYYRGRAITIGANSAFDAVQYAIQHRGDLSSQDFNSIVNSYRTEALHEQAVSMYYGASHASSPTTTEPPSNASEPPAKRADPKMVFNALEVPNEGSKLVIDSNGKPVRYGINQGYNHDVDVSKLTLAGAQQLFVDRVWNKSGADKLAPALAVVHADTFFLNEKEAAKILKQSGGDVQKYIELRNNFLASLHASNPAKYPDYTSRNNRVEQYAAAVGGDGTPFSFSGRVTPSTSMGSVTDEVMARKDIPLGLKTAIIELAREDRNQQREDKRISEDDARDTLITATTKLGDKFTSVTQLPQGAFTRASPETIAALTEQARTNRYKHNDENLRPTVSFTMVTDPQKFMTKDFVEELMRKGASPSLIGEVQAQQASILKKQMNAKPDVISDGSLWSVAKPAFEAAGIINPDQKARKQRAQQQEHAVGFLQQLATEWANNNPGQRPTPEIMRQWVGAALLQTKSGSRLFEADDADVYNSIPDNVRSVIVRDLRRNGDTANGTALIADVAKYYRKLRSIYGTGPIALSTRDGGIVGRPMRGNDTVGEDLADGAPSQ